MRPEPRVLIMGRRKGVLDRVAAGLEHRGLNVDFAADPAAALARLGSGHEVSLVIASRSTSEAGSQEFLGQAKRLFPELPVIWGFPLDESSLLEPGSGPEFQAIWPAALEGVVAALLAQRSQRSAIAEALEIGALQVLEGVGGFAVEATRLHHTEAAPAELCALIAFSGGARGHMMVSMTREHAQALHRRFFAGAPAATPHMEDLVGELCNQILGRVNVFFLRHALAIQHTTPIFLCPAGKVLRYPVCQPTFALELTGSDARIALEYFLAECDEEKLQRPPVAEVVALDEVCFF